MQDTVAWLQVARTGRRLVGAQAVGIALIALLSACEGRGPSREAMIVRDSAGVTIVDNDHTQPVWTPQTRWRLSARPSIQVGNQPFVPDQRLYGAQHARRLSDLGLAVVNAGLGDVRVFDAGGYHLATIPVVVDVTATDARRPRRVYQLPGDTLVVYMDGAELLWYSPSFQYVRRARITPSGVTFEGELQPLGEFSDGTLLLGGNLALDPSLTGVQRYPLRLMRYSAGGDLLDTFGDFPGDTYLMGDGTYVFGATAYATAADSTLWYGPGDTFDLREVARGGRTLRILRLDKPPEEITAADFQAFRVAAVRRLRSTMSDSAAEATVDSYIFAEVFPVHERIVVDALGNVWALNYRWFDLGADRLWTVFDPSGRYLGEVVTPHLLDVDQIGADWVLGRMNDGRGGEAAYIYRLEKPETGG